MTMRAFDRVRGIAAPLPLSDVNTDAIIPSRWLRAASQNLAAGLFGGWRYDPEGNPKPDFVLNAPRYAAPRFLVAGANFGCGSSREAAVYALYDYGIRCVIAPSFGDIFAGNSAQNGFLLAEVSDTEAEAMRDALAATPDLPVTVDLAQQTIVYGNRSIAFCIDPVRRKRLLNGWDDIALTESYRERIAAFKAHDRSERPWALPRV